MLFPFVLITFFFFLWGFARAILDILNPFFQETLHLTKMQASAVQFVTYLAYFLMAVPAGQFIRRFGTRRGVVGGLVLFGLGATGFCLSGCVSGVWVFGLFLLMLFVIGCGLATLEVAANPYVTLLGDRATAASRLNRAQSFNGAGCICGSLLGGLYCFSGDRPDISLPYIVIGVVVLLIAVVFSKIKLPEVVMEEVQAPVAAGGVEMRLRRHPMFVFGLLALFCYEVSEISINSFFVNYAAETDLVGRKGPAGRQPQAGGLAGAFGGIAAVYGRPFSGQLGDAIHPGRKGAALLHFECRGADAVCGARLSGGVVCGFAAHLCGRVHYVSHHFRPVD